MQKETEPDIEADKLAGEQVITTTDTTNTTVTTTNTTGTTTHYAGDNDDRPASRQSAEEDEDDVRRADPDVGRHDGGGRPKAEPAEAQLHDLWQ